MDTEKAYNLPYIKNASITASKTINDYLSRQRNLSATDFGIVVLNNDKKEIKTTYTFNEKIYTAAVKATISIAYVPTASYTAVMSTESLMT